MSRTKLAALWAAAILVAAIAASIGFMGDDMAEGLYYGLLLGAAVSIGQSPCRSC